MEHPLEIAGIFTFKKTSKNDFQLLPPGCWEKEELTNVIISIYCLSIIARQQV